MWPCRTATTTRLHNTAVTAAAAVAVATASAGSSVHDERWWDAVARSGGRVDECGCAPWRRRRRRRRRRHRRTPLARPRSSHGKTRGLDPTESERARPSAVPGQKGARNGDAGGAAVTASGHAFLDGSPQQ